MFVIEPDILETAKQCNSPSLKLFEAALLLSQQLPSQLIESSDEEVGDSVMLKPRNQHESLASHP